jgi:hypothetical protein
VVLCGLVVVVVVPRVVDVVVTDEVVVDRGTLVEVDDDVDGLGAVVVVARVVDVAAGSVVALVIGADLGLAAFGSVSGRTRM